MSKRARGTVYLVGAGPGDPGLISVRGAELLRRADLVVYDHLVNPALLAETKPGCVKLYAGKTAKAHTLTQRQINRALLRSAKKHAVVVRLKGGDPFLFGRGGEEAMELAKAGVPFEVVPGITSAIAGPAYAGIPVTHRDFTSQVTVVTGHEDPRKSGSHLDWKKLAHDNTTLVFLMGVGNLPQIARKLVENGMDRKTPVAAIEWATWPRQRTVTGTLKNIAFVLKKNKIEPPAVIVVGKVASLRREINWAERRPLFGKRIVVTRARAQASGLSQELRERGAEVVEFPAIRIEPLKNYSRLDREIGRLGEYDWLVFTSVNGVEHFFARLKARRKDARSLAGVKLAAIGPATRGALEEKGLRADLFPKEFVAEAVLREFKRQTTLQGKKILIPRAKEARETLVEGLRAAGAAVSEVPAYQTVVDRCGKREILESLKNFPPDAVTFTSSSTVKNFLKLVGKNGARKIFEKTRFISIGPITSKTARENKINIAAQARQYTIPGLITAVEKLLKPDLSLRGAERRSNLEMASPRSQ